jgi:hypothetical protein
VEQKKEAIKEGVLTCLNLLRSTIRESNQIAPSTDPKKKIIIKKKKNLDILHDRSDDEEEKENQPTTPQLEENGIRRKTVRGSNTSKRSVSIKTPDEESPSKRAKKTSDIDEPLPVISPTVVKKVTPTRNKTDADGEEKKAKSLRLTRKAPSTTEEQKPVEAVKSTKKTKKEEVHTEEETEVRVIALLTLDHALTYRKSRLSLVRNQSCRANLRLMCAIIKANRCYIKQ